jgi:circadian clock protein KaiB
VPAAAEEVRRFMSKYILKLFITGRTAQSDLALRNLRHICDHDLGMEYELEVIDVLEHPQLAEDEKIHATPMLVRESPSPVRHIAGDLSDSEKVLYELGLEIPRSDS